MSEYPAITEPTLDPHSLLRTVRELKELVELLTGQRNSATADLVSRMNAAEQAINFVLSTTGGDVAIEVRNARGGQIDLATRITQVNAAIPAAFLARSVTAGTGVTGGGNLSADRAFALDLTYTDGRYTQPAAITAAFAGRTISAGTGVTGGGNLSADRTFSLDVTYTDGRYTQLGLAYGAVGTYLWSTAGASSAGASVAGGSLVPAQSGNWRQMSNNVSGGGLFLRVS